MAQDYELLGLLGSGGMGEVYLASPRGRPEERVALKRLRGAAADGREQIRREARIGALLQHPNIASVKAFGEDDQGPFLVMEYVEGASLERLVAGASEAFSAEEVVGLALALGRALAAAHAYSEGGRPRAVLHRDVSLDNVLVSRRGEVKLTDFGVARIDGGTTQTQQGTLKGKISYLAPERFEGAEATPAADLFAMGVTLFRTASGISPFAGATEAQVIHAVLHVQPPRLGTLRPELPAVLSEAIDSCLQKDPALRPTAAQLVERLLAWESAAGAERLAARVAVVAAREPLIPSAPRTQTSIRQRPKRRKAGVLAAIPAVIVAGVGAWLASRPPPPEVTPSLVHVEAPASVPEVAPAPAEAVVPAEAAVVPKPPPIVSRPPPSRPAAKPKVQPAPAEPPPAPEPVAGALAIKVRPWGRVFVDGKLVGTTPLAPLSLPAGRHSVIVVNEELNARRQQEVVVPAGGTETLRIFLD